MSSLLAKPADRKLTDYPCVHIENVVASTFLGVGVDLVTLARKLVGAEYNPERFPGVVLRTESPKAATLIFRSGKIVCTGAKSVDDVYYSLRRVFQEIRNLGVAVQDSPITIQNIVASADLGVEMDLEMVASAIGLENVEFEPEMFPGLVRRLEEPKAVILLFGSGKMIITGAQSVRDCESALGRIIQELTGLGLLKENGGVS